MIVDVFGRGNLSMTELPPTLGGAFFSGVQVIAHCITLCVGWASLWLGCIARRRWAVQASASRVSILHVCMKSSMCVCCVRRRALSGWDCFGVGLCMPAAELRLCVSLLLSCDFCCYIHRDEVVFGRPSTDSDGFRFF